MGVQTPCTAFLQEMMPNLLELARVLHSLWYPDTRSAVPPEAHVRRLLAFRSADSAGNEQDIDVGCLGAQGIFDIDEHFIAIVLRTFFSLSLCAVTDLEWCALTNDEPYVCCWECRPNPR